MIRIITTAITAITAITALVALAAAAAALPKSAPSVAGDPSCALASKLPPTEIGTAPIPLALQDLAGTLVPGGVAPLRWKGSPGILVIDARFADPAQKFGPDLEIIRCEKLDRKIAQRAEPGTVPTPGQLGLFERGGPAITLRPVRLDRSFDRGGPTNGTPGRSRAALTITDLGDYVILVGGAPPGAAVTATLQAAGTERPPLQHLQLPTTTGAIDAGSPRQNASLRPYVLYDLKVDAERPLLFSGTSTAPMFLEVGDASDDGAFDWFGLRRAASAGGREGEVQRLTLWRALMTPGKASVFGLTLRPGSYLVRLRGAKPDSFGSYSVTITEPSAADLARIADPTPIKLGTTRGTLIIGESYSQSANGTPQFRPAKLFTLNAKAGTGYEVRLESVDKAFDVALGAGSMVPLLVVPGRPDQSTADGSKFVAVLANDDHGGVEGMLNPNDSCLFFKSQKSGPVILRGASSLINQSGDFTLTVKEAAEGCKPTISAAS